MPKAGKTETRLWKPNRLRETRHKKVLARQSYTVMSPKIDNKDFRHNSGSRFTVYFDKSCPLCRREIEFYLRRKGAHDIDWVDVSEPESAPTGISCEQAMARFHVQTLDGKLVDGGAAFAELWKQLPAFRYLGILFSVRPMRWMINLTYNLFLPLRPLIQKKFQRFTKDPERPTQ